MSSAVRGVLLLVVFIGVLVFVSNTGKGGPIMAGIFAFAGIPLFIVALRMLAGKDD